MCFYDLIAHFFLMLNNTPLSGCTTVYFSIHLLLDILVVIGNKALLIIYKRRRQWHPTPVLLPGKSHGQRSLVNYSPWGCWESDTTERLHFHTLEKEMTTHTSILAWRIPGTGALWAAVYGVAQSRTRLTWLSSSSNYLQSRFLYDLKFSTPLGTFQGAHLLDLMARVCLLL